MLTQAGPPRSIVAVKFRSTQHRQPEVWHRHLDCDVVDLASTSGRSHESRVSAGRKLMCVYGARLRVREIRDARGRETRNREIGTKRKSCRRSKVKWKPNFYAFHRRIVKVSFGFSLGGMTNQTVTFENVYAHVYGSGNYTWVLSVPMRGFQSANFLAHCRDRATA